MTAETEQKGPEVGREVIEMDHSQVYPSTLPLAKRLEILEDWVISKDSDLLSCVPSSGKGQLQALRVIMRRSLVHPRAKDEVLELPYAFRWIFCAGLRDGEASVQFTMLRALGIGERGPDPKAVVNRRPGRAAG